MKKCIRFILYPFFAHSGFPRPWDRYLCRRFEYYARIPLRELMGFQFLVLEFMKDREFTGARGLVVDTKHRLLVSAVAVRMARRISLEFFSRVRRVVIYPGPFEDGDGDLADGQADTRGTVRLAWSAVVDGAAGPSDGQCVVTHEFAHALDALGTGSFDGNPKSPRQNHYRAWADLLYAEFLKMRHTDRAWHRYVPDESMKEPVEFFATLTELFFERPVTMKKNLPEIYGLFREFFKQDPAEERD